MSRPTGRTLEGAGNGTTVGYRGKVEEQEQARVLRAQAWTLQEIADELGVAKSSVSLWVRDVEFDRDARRSAATGRRPRGIDHPLRQRKLAEIAACDAWGRDQIGALSERDLLIAGTALYAGEGSKRDGCVGFANTNADMMRLFCRWLRAFFQVEEDRVRVLLYLHDGLDLNAAVAFWSDSRRCHRRTSPSLTGRRRTRRFATPSTCTDVHPSAVPRHAFIER